MYELFIASLGLFLSLLFQFSLRKSKFFEERNHILSSFVSLGPNMAHVPHKHSTIVAAIHEETFSSKTFNIAVLLSTKS